MIEIVPALTSAAVAALVLGMAVVADRTASRAAWRRIAAAHRQAAELRFTAAQDVRCAECRARLQEQ